MIPKLRFNEALTIVLNVYPIDLVMINVNKYTNGNVIATAKDPRRPRKIVTIIRIRIEVSRNQEMNALKVVLMDISSEDISAYHRFSASKLDLCSCRYFFTPSITLRMSDPGTL